MKTLSACLLGFLVSCASGQLSSKLENVPANTWVAIDSAYPGAMVSWSNMVYAPERGTALIWGAICEANNQANDVRYFDTADAAWKSDYVSTFSNTIDNFGAKSSMGAGNVPVPAHTFHCSYYDRNRGRLICPMPGLMPAYDPVAKTWTNTGARVRLYGRDYAGAPPVYWSAACYDPVNDAMVLFPHSGGANFDDWEITGKVSGNLGTFVFKWSDSLWQRVTFPPDSAPQARMSSPMAYDTVNRVILMFGGSTQGRWLSDTWVYDVTGRKWARKNPAVVPPPRAEHFLLYLPAHGLFLMGGGYGPSGGQLRDLWTYDAGLDKWTHVAGDLPQYHSWDYGNVFLTAALLENRGLVLLLMTGNYASSGKTLVYRFVPGDTLPPVSWTPPAEAEGTADAGTFPPDSTAVVAHWAGLEKNRWVEAGPDREPSRRDWGIYAYDPGWHTVAYYGGGHATYMGDDIEMYFPGANRWIRSHTPYWAQYPQTSGYMYTAGFYINGGPKTEHQRQSYQVLNGKLYYSYGAKVPYHYGPDSLRNRVQWALSGPGYQQNGMQGVSVYDWTKPGQWNFMVPKGMTMPLGGLFADTAEGGRLLFPKGAPYWQDPGSWAYTNCVLRLDQDTMSRFSVTYTPMAASPRPEGMEFEGKHFSYLMQRKQIFAFGSNANTHVLETWLYDVAANVWQNLNPSSSPPDGHSGELVYIPGYDVVYAAIGNQNRGWIYSFRLNSWLPHTDSLPGQWWGCWDKVVWDTRFRMLIAQKTWGEGSKTYVCPLSFPDSLVDPLGAAGEGFPVAAPLLGATPNPFNPVVKITLSGILLKAASVRILDISGRVVADLSDKVKAGTVSWNAAGRPSGVYLIIVKQGKQVTAKKTFMTR